MNATLIRLIGWANNASSKIRNKKAALNTSQPTFSNYCQLDIAEKCFYLLSYLLCKTCFCSSSCLFWLVSKRKHFLKIHKKEWLSGCEQTQQCSTPIWPQDVILTYCTFKIVVGVHEPAAAVQLPQTGCSSDVGRK